MFCDDGQAWGRHVSVVLGVGLLEDVITVRRVPKHILMHSGSRSRAVKEVEAFNSKTKEKKNSA